MRTVERFLFEGTPYPTGLFNALPDGWRERAMDTSLLLRWRRYRGRVGENLRGFPVAPRECSPGALIAGMASAMAQVSNLDLGLTRGPQTTAWPTGEEPFVSLVHDILDRGRGLIILTARHGYWQRPLQQIVQTVPVSLLHPKRLIPHRFGLGLEPDTRRTPVRESEGDRLASAISALGRNEVVVVLQDVPRRNGPWEPVSLLGRRVRVSAASLVLSQLAGAPSLPVLCPLVDGQPAMRWTVPFDAGGECSGRAAIHHMGELLDGAIRENPAQWLGWLQRWCEPVHFRCGRRAPIRVGAMLAGAH